MKIHPTPAPTNDSLTFLALAFSLAKSSMINPKPPRTNMSPDENPSIIYRPFSLEKWVSHTKASI